MFFSQVYSLVVLAILLILLVIAVIIICILTNQISELKEKCESLSDKLSLKGKKKDNRGQGHSEGNHNNSKETEKLKEYNVTYFRENEQLRKSNDDLQEEISRLNQRINDLTLENNELNKLYGSDPVLNVKDTPSSENQVTDNNKTESKDKNIVNDKLKSSIISSHIVVSNQVEEHSNTSKEESKAEHKEVLKPETKDELKTEHKEALKPETKEELKAEHKEALKPEAKEEAKPEAKEEASKEKTMYASFPRSADSCVYFSDLSENLLEDSYFELRLSSATGKATFKPLDFMKIRNYDAAMAAMLTEGVKPNVASTVQRIEHGKAHIEGKDWIIDNPAKIKLA